MTIRAGLLGLLLLSACARTEPPVAGPQPPGEVYGSALPAGTTGWSNASLADIFVLLVHRHEWGENRPRLWRLPQPVRVALSGTGSAAYAGFLDRFLAEVAARSRIDIARAGAGTDTGTGTGTGANMTVRFVPGRDFRVAEGLVCLVVPGDVGWDDFTADPLRWSWARADALGGERRATVFLPDTHPPHAVRECLMEEILQGLGPGNDLYGLAWTVFNDDEAHLWPTAIDYLMLRVLYDPAMRPGQDAEQSRARARTVLDRINPAGRAAPALPPVRQAAFQDWRDRMIELGSAEVSAERQVRALWSLAAEAGRRAPGGNHHCHALMRLADTALSLRPETAGQALAEAAEVCRATHGPDDIRGAQIRLMEALHLARTGEWPAVNRALDGLAERFLAHGQEAAAVAALSLELAAGARLGKPARDVDRRLDVARWSAYAFGEDANLTRALAQNQGDTDR